MKKDNDRKSERAMRFTSLRLTVWSALALVILAGPRAWAEKSDTPAAVGGGLVARVLPAAEKIKVLEDELA